MTTPPTPEATRRADVPAHPIVLADGRAWGFARPATRLKPIVVAGLDEAGRPAVWVEARAVVEYPPEVRRRVEAMRAALGGGPEEGRLAALFDLAAALLRRAHEVDPPTAAALLDLGGDLPRFAAELIAVAFVGPPDRPPHPPEGRTHG